VQAGWPLIIDDRSGITKTELTEGGADEVRYDAASNHGVLVVRKRPGGGGRGYLGTTIW